MCWDAADEVVAARRQVERRCQLRQRVVPGGGAATDHDQLRGQGADRRQVGLTHRAQPGVARILVHRELAGELAFGHAGDRDLQHTQRVERGHVEDGNARGMVGYFSGAFSMLHRHCQRRQGGGEQGRGTGGEQAAPARLESVHQSPWLNAQQRPGSCNQDHRAVDKPKDQNLTDTLIQ
ncbi:hypothetical protein [Cupriavidus oxalaticus]|uniref:Uncharacterized protein n=1 Tax=Cupriavidus oxalaticus TaxID=96344 RepID=A0A4P7L508_9BURK|nr:hypothetical protein [Cupriavidus oxalaticus]QBY50420.1 hypothetical protein E0W60_04235 [Cupriavidus oxalaticus]